MGPFFPLDCVEGCRLCCVVSMDRILDRSIHIRDPFFKLMDLLLCILILILTSVQ